jgi:hypothetical protein
VRPITPTAAPSRAINRAEAAPIPLPAPVIKATLFVNRHRERLFPEVPVVATMDQRRVKESGVSTNMTAVTLDLN